MIGYRPIGEAGLTLIPEEVPEPATLRDQFAMAALTGALASGIVEARAREHLARACYELADAMLAERERK